MSTDGPTEKIPTTPAGSTTTGRTEPEATTAAYPTASTDPLSAFDEPAAAPGTPAATAPGGSTGPGRSTGPGAPVGPGTPASAPETPARRGVRVGTFVWGLVIVAVGIGVLALSAGYTLDVELALIVLLGAAGAAMLVGSLLKGRRGGSR